MAEARKSTKDLYPLLPVASHAWLASQGSPWESDALPLCWPPADIVAELRVLEVPDPFNAVDLIEAWIVSGQLSNSDDVHRAACLLLPLRFRGAPHAAVVHQEDTAVRSLRELLEELKRVGACG